MGGEGYFVEVFNILPSALKTNTCVQHKEIHAPEAPVDFRFQIFPLVDFADVHGVCLYVFAVFEEFFGLGEGLGVVVDEDNLHAMGAAELCDGEADA